MVKLLLLLSILSFSLFAKDVNIAVIAISGEKICQKEWLPTIEHLQQSLPDYNFKLTPVEPHNIEHLKTLIHEKKIDFVITQPAIYIELELDLGMSRILTMIKHGGLAEFGSAFIVKKNSPINTIDDIKKKRVSAVAPLGFGGWLIGYNELVQRGIDPVENNLVSFEGTQVNVIQAVIDNKSEVGVIRTGMLEKLDAKGFKGLKKLRVLQPRKISGFPYLVSTDLYPEWALAKAQNVSNELAREVALVFLDISKESEAAKSASYEAWTFPYNYQPVHDLMKRLQVGVYEDYYTMSFEEILHEYKYVFLAMTFIFFILIVFLGYSQKMNSRLQVERGLKHKAMSLMETIFDLQTNLIFVCKGGEVTKVNQSFLDFFGCEDLADFNTNKPSLESYFEYIDDASYISEQSYPKGWVHIVNENRDKHYKVKIGTSIFEVSIKSLNLEEHSYIIALSDITYLEDNKTYLEAQIGIAKKKILKNERELNRQSKLAAMGEMIGVIAHQLKQPLSVISIVNNNILMDLAFDKCEKEVMAENTDKISRHIATMSSTIDDFRNFFRPDKLKKTFKVEHCIFSVLELMKPMLDERKIEIIYEGNASIEVVSLENELFHVIMNIINNAKDALEINKTEQPRIFIRLEQEKEKVLLSIEDNAGGIEEKIIHKIFDQYFTTKKSEGTGLGLHLTKIIVKESLGGSLHVKNGKYGACFTIEL